VTIAYTDKVDCLTVNDHTSMSDYDYSVQYSFFHEPTLEHAKRVAEWQKERLAPHLPDDKTVPVIDIGCGFGFTLLALRDMGFTNVRGIDIDQGQIERAVSFGLPAEVQPSIIGFLDLKPAYYGAVVLLDGLEHLPKPEQIPTIRAIYEALRPNGVLIISVPNATSPVAMRWLYDDFTHFASFTERSLKFVLRNAGFRDEYFVLPAERQAEYSALAQRRYRPVEATPSS
jgi:2-polyprenyl-3-methyl-5-hydroxy-6-metoxy-1,4-benzoquinol methylase